MSGLLSRCPEGVCCRNCSTVWPKAEGGACEFCNATDDLCTRDTPESRVCVSCLTYRGDGVRHEDVCEPDLVDDDARAWGPVGPPPGWKS